MNADLRHNKDLWAGLMFIGIGAAAMFMARNYQFGSAMHMGPGFFPTLLGGILIAFGIYIMASGLRSGEKIHGHLSPRPLIMLPLALVLFSILVEKAGFLPALLVLVFVSAASGRKFKFLEVLLLTMLLAVVAIAVFIWGLELPYPLIKGL